MSKHISRNEIWYKKDNGYTSLYGNVEIKNGKWCAFPKVIFKNFSNYTFIGRFKRLREAQVAVENYVNKDYKDLINDTRYKLL